MGRSGWKGFSQEGRGPKRNHMNGWLQAEAPNRKSGGEKTAPKLKGGLQQLVEKFFGVEKSTERKKNENSGDRKKERRRLHRKRMLRRENVVMGRRGRHLGQEYWGKAVGKNRMLELGNSGRSHRSLQ